MKSLGIVPRCSTTWRAVYSRMMPSNRALSKYRCIAATSRSNGVCGWASASMMAIGSRSSLSQFPLRPQESRPLHHPTIRRGCCGVAVILIAKRGQLGGAVASVLELGYQRIDFGTPLGGNGQRVVGADVDDHLKQLFLFTGGKLLAAADLVDLGPGVLVGRIAAARGASAKLLDPIAVDHDALAVDAVDSERS